MKQLNWQSFSQPFFRLSREIMGEGDALLCNPDPENPAPLTSPRERKKSALTALHFAIFIDVLYISNNYFTRIKQMEFVFK